MAAYLGIDPGKSGGIALLRLQDGITRASAIKMPETEGDIVTALESIKSKYPDTIVYIERVGPMPKQGVTGVFKFGYSAGTLKGILSALHFTTHYVTPQKWQRALGCLTKGDKLVTKRKAQELFPDLSITHAVADALLIAYYGKTERLK